MSEEPAAGFTCPICGKDTPHQHRANEVSEWRERELWVDRSWQDMRHMMDTALKGDWKPPINCGCEDDHGKPDPECVFCGHPNEQEARP